jgi:mannose-6-phosphate isomerase-like protein (cupin superfamily)
MEKVSIEALDVDLPSEGIYRRRLSPSLDTSDLALNHYRIAPGQGFPGGLHAHMDQEEVFVVLAGAATFETMDGEVTVQANEAIRFSRGEFQSGRNAGEEDLVALAIGAPRETEDVRIPADCPACGHKDLRLDWDQGGLRFQCPACEAEYIPEECPECGDGDLRLTIAEPGRTEVICTDCEAAMDAPPIRQVS